MGLTTAMLLKRFCSETELCFKTKPCKLTHTSLSWQKRNIRLFKGPLLKVRYGVMLLHLCRLHYPKCHRYDWCVKCKFPIYYYNGFSGYGLVCLYMLTDFPELLLSSYDLTKSTKNVRRWRKSQKVAHFALFQDVQKKTLLKVPGCVKLLYERTENILIWINVFS